MVIYLVGNNASNKLEPYLEIRFDYQNAVWVCLVVSIFN